MGCHDPQKYFNSKVLRMKKFNTKISQITAFEQQFKDEGA